MAKIVESIKKLVDPTIIHQHWQFFIKEAVKRRPYRLILIIGGTILVTLIPVLMTVLDSQTFLPEKEVTLFVVFWLWGSCVLIPPFLIDIPRFWIRNTQLITYFERLSDKERARFLRSRICLFLIINFFVEAFVIISGSLIASFYL